MKRIILTLAIAVTSVTNMMALSASRSREEAHFLTDKMAYELGLDEYQIQDVYEINYDYFRALDNVRMDYGRYDRIRASYLRDVLTPAQWDLYMGYSHFINPVRVIRGAWNFVFYNHYRHGHYYYARPHYVHTFRGGYSGHRRVAPHHSAPAYGHRNPAPAPHVGRPGYGNRPGGRVERPRDDRRDHYRGNGHMDNGNRGSYDRPRNDNRGNGRVDNGRRDNGNRGSYDRPRNDNRGNDRGNNRERSERNHDGGSHHRR